MAKPHSIPPFPKDIDRDSFGHWLSGFSDGEACFSIRLCHNKVNPQYCRVQPMAAFIIGLRADDFSVLQSIQSYFQCGCLCFRPKSNRPNGKPSWTFAVGGADKNYTVIAPHFERYPLRAKKARDFIAWKKGVDLMWRVKQSPHGSRKNGAPGMFRIWTPKLLKEFASYVEELKVGKQYKISD